MTPTRSPRSLAAVWLAIALALAAMAGPPAILGAQASAEYSATPLPGPIPPDTIASVSPGAAVAYDVFFDNIDTSNISQLYLNAATPNDGQNAPPNNGTLLAIESESRPGTCAITLSNDLSCAFGTVTPADSPIMLRVVYETPDSAGDFDVHFLFSTTGVSGDKKKNSHGDDYDAFTHVALVESDHFEGGYALNTDQVADLKVFSRQNPQWTAVNPPVANIPVVVAERRGSTFTCPGASAASCFGEWSYVSVNNGANYANTGGFTVQLGYDANKPKANFVHLFDAGVIDPVTMLPYELIDGTCSDSSPLASELPCKIVETSGGDTFVTLWLKVNGNIKGY
jgi:hypothetical protein